MKQFAIAFVSQDLKEKKLLKDLIKFYRSKRFEPLQRDCHFFYEIFNNTFSG
jgi:hypothetical protein